MHSFEGLDVRIRQLLMVLIADNYTVNVHVAPLWWSHQSQVFSSRRVRFGLDGSFQKRQRFRLVGWASVSFEKEGMVIARNSVLGYFSRALRSWRRRTSFVATRFL